MKIGIDSYCFHRLFGEVYPGQQSPEKKNELRRFFDKSRSLAN